ncbi:MAG: MerR family transcriptional regulator, partial [Jannaschia sp.]
MARSPEKSDGAFRTIREVADWLGVPTHVLRFWESKFNDIAPVKGAGGRRYYRPDDMRLLGGIKVLLHDQGLTIRGVSQKIDDDGTEPVMALSPELDMLEGTPSRTRRVIRSGAEDEGARVVPFEAPEASESDTSETSRPAIAKDPATPLEETLPDQPDAPHADLLETAPGRDRSEPQTPARPTDNEDPMDDPADLPDAPSDDPDLIVSAPDSEPLDTPSEVPQPEPSTDPAPVDLPTSAPPPADEVPAPELAAPVPETATSPITAPTPSIPAPQTPAAAAPSRTPALDALLL